MELNGTIHVATDTVKLVAFSNKVETLRRPPLQSGPDPRNKPHSIPKSVTCAAAVSAYQPAADEISLVGFHRRCSGSCSCCSVQNGGPSVCEGSPDNCRVALRSPRTWHQLKMERRLSRASAELKLPASRSPSVETVQRNNNNSSSNNYNNNSTSNAETIITPPQDFRDHVKIFEPPPMFREGDELLLRHSRARPTNSHRPKTDFFWPPLGSGHPFWTPVCGDSIEKFTEELQRLKSHSLFFKLPLDGSGPPRVQYRSSRSVIEYSSSANGSYYSFRTEQHSETLQSSFDVSETESDEDDDVVVSDKPGAKDAESVAARRSPRAVSPSVSAARLSSSSGVSSTPATSSDADADGDSGIDGVSPRLSGAAFGEHHTLSPSQSILYIDSCSARNSVVDPQGDEAQRQSLFVGAEGDPRRDRSYRVALELLTTERTYVEILHLLDQVFQFRVDQENRAHNMFPADQVPQMFSNIKSLFKLHHDFLLPRLEERMCQWDTQPRIGDILANFAPFLKMYAEYVRNFDHAVSLISSAAARCPRFAAIVEEIQQMPECGQLSLQHHMLTPIQRVPRYEMLLRDYLRRLPEDSEDRPDTEKALHLVSTAANHANEAMKKIDQFKQLLEIQESLGGSVDLVSPTRELLKEGKIVKISARSGDHQERYLFLFTDLLLLCSPRLIGNRVIGVGLPPYRLRAKFNIANLEVLEGDNLETANTFYLRESTKTVELYTSTPEEKESWIDALFAAMTELTRRKSSLRVSPAQTPGWTPETPTPTGNQTQESAENLTAVGKIAPILVKMDSVSRCYACDAHFTVMRRKHHCHACGKVVCNRCSSRKIILPYETLKPLRVCDSCFRLIHAKDRTLSARSTGHDTKLSPTLPAPLASPSSPELCKYPPGLRTGLLEVSVDEPSVLCGYLHLKTRGKTWNKRWFALRNDFVLYTYKTNSSESRAMTATPVPGYTVTLLTGVQGSLDSTAGAQASESNSERERSFKMAHARKSYTFQAATREEAERWVSYLQMAARADLPISS